MISLISKRNILIVEPEMGRMFEVIQADVPKDEFIAVLEANERKAECYKAKDSTAWKIIEFHRVNDRQTYKRINLMQEGLNRLILPHHTHDDDQWPGIGPTGGCFWHVVDKYLDESARPLLDGRVCCHKVHELKRLRTWETSPSFVSNDPDFAVRGHYRRQPGEYFYGGGFHRLVASGVWMKENNQFPPLELFFCEVLVGGSA